MDDIRMSPMYYRRYMDDILCIIGDIWMMSLLYRCIIGDIWMSLLYLCRRYMDDIRMSLLYLCIIGDICTDVL